MEAETTGRLEGQEKWLGDWMSTRRECTPEGLVKSRARFPMPPTFRGHGEDVPGKTRLGGRAAVRSAGCRAANHSLPQPPAPHTLPARLHAGHAQPRPLPPRALR